MKAVKANKVYTIDEVQKAGYIAQGFDIQDDVGTVIAYGKGKTVPYTEYAEAIREIERLQILATELNQQAKASGSENDESVIRILSAYAAEHEIDLGRASTVSGIVKKIEERVYAAPEGSTKEGE